MCCAWRQSHINKPHWNANSPTNTNKLAKSSFREYIILLSYLMDTHSRKSLFMQLSAKMYLVVRYVYCTVNLPALHLFMHEESYQCQVDNFRGGSMWSNHPELTHNHPTHHVPPFEVQFDKAQCCRTSVLTCLYDRKFACFNILQAVKRAGYMCGVKNLWSD